jgi:hypothetical protein
MICARAFAGVATATGHATGYSPYAAYGQGGYGGYGGYPQGGYGGYGGYAPQQTAEFSFKCNVDYRGYITDVDLDRNNYAYRRY